jgi:hypothetical protein
MAAAARLSCISLYTLRYALLILGLKSDIPDEAAAMRHAQLVIGPAGSGKSTYVFLSSSLHTSALPLDRDRDSVTCWSGT